MTTPKACIVTGVDQVISETRQRERPLTVIPVPVRLSCLQTSTFLLVFSWPATTEHPFVVEQKRLKKKAIFLLSFKLSAFVVLRCLDTPMKQEHEFLIWLLKSFTLVLLVIRDYFLNQAKISLEVMTNEFGFDVQHLVRLYLCLEMSS